MGSYYKNRIWDILCCMIMSTALSINVFTGYEIKDEKASSILITGIVCIICTLILFAAGYNRKTTLAGIFAAVFLIVAAIIAVRSFSSGGGKRIDRNPALFWMITIAVSAICYLGSRWRLSLIGLMIGAAVMSAAFGFLKYPIHLPAYLVFMATILVLYLFRVYYISLLASYTGSVRFTRYTMQSLAFVLVIGLAAGGIFYGVIRPLDPPTRELKLITKLQSFEILEQVGVSRRTEVQDQSQSTKTENDETRMTNQKKDQDEQNSPQEEKDESLKGEIRQQTKTEKAQAVNYRQDHSMYYILLVLLIVLLAAAPFVIHYLLRKRWEKKVQEADPTDGAVMIYKYLIKKLRYAGFTKPPEMTLFRYMKGQKRAMRSFAVGSTDLFALTRIYQKVLYGCHELDPDDFRRFWKVYSAFRVNLKKKIGTFRYALRFFFL